MKELWQDERSKAGISLALWGVFLLFVFILVSCGSQNIKPTPETKIDTESISYKLDSLLTSDNGFKMTILKKDESSKRIYDTSFVTSDDSNYEGYVEDLSGMNRFKCNTACYKVFLDHEEEEPLYYEELINTINSLKIASSKLELDEDKSYFYKDENSSLKVYVNDQKQINKITIDTELDSITFDINYNNKNA